MLLGLSTSNNTTNMWALMASGNRRRKQTAKIAKKKIPRKRKAKVKPSRFKKRQHKAMKKHYKKRYHKPKPKKRHYKPKQRKGLSYAERQAKAWIAWHESRGRWHVSNGYCYGKYQLSYSYLHGDYSPANQTRTADRYVHGRYHSWQNAKRFWQYHHWY